MQKTEIKNSADEGYPRYGLSEAAYYFYTQWRNFSYDTAKKIWFNRTTQEEIPLDEMISYFETIKPPNAMLNAVPLKDKAILLRHFNQNTNIETGKFWFKSDSLPRINGQQFTSIFTTTQNDELLYSVNFRFSDYNLFLKQEEVPQSLREIFEAEWKFGRKCTGFSLRQDKNGISGPCSVATLNLDQYGQYVTLYAQNYRDDEHVKEFEYFMLRICEKRYSTFENVRFRHTLIDFLHKNYSRGVITKNYMGDVVDIQYIARLSNPSNLRNLTFDMHTPYEENCKLLQKFKDEINFLISQSDVEMDHQFKLKQFEKF